MIALELVCIYRRESIIIFSFITARQTRIIHTHTRVRRKPCSRDLHRRPSTNNLIAQWKRQLRRRYSSGHRWLSGYVSVITLAAQLNSMDDFVCGTAEWVCTNLTPLVECGLKTILTAQTTCTNSWIKMRFSPFLKFWLKVLNYICTISIAINHRLPRMR